MTNRAGLPVNQHDLIPTRLRNVAHNVEMNPHHADLLREAADRIEELERAVLTDDQPS